VLDRRINGENFKAYVAHLLVILSGRECASSNWRQHVCKRAGRAHELRTFAPPPPCLIASGGR
jgi:hypothetical protein